MLELIQTISLIIIAVIAIVSTEYGVSIKNRFSRIKHNLNIKFRLLTLRNKVRLLFKKK